LRLARWYDEVQDFIDSGSQAPTVVIGDSMVKLGDWDDILQAQTVNRGIGGDTTALILERNPINGYSFAQDAYLFMGVNDIFRNATVATSFSYYTQVVNAVKAMGMRVTLICTLYCNPTMSAACTLDRLQKIKDLIALIKTIPGVRCIDANTLLSDNDGLKSIYTYDGVHLNSTGYALLGQIIRGEI
jgi:lysophospholipase L1-like esterase